MRLGSRLAARLAKEDQDDLAAHVEGGEEGGNRQQPVNGWLKDLGLGQDLILGPETCQWEDARQRQRAYQVDPEGGLHAVAQAAHVAHVLRVKMVLVPHLPAQERVVLHGMVAVLHALDDRAGREEEQRLEEGVRHQVEHARRKSAHAHRRHHEAKLADGGISQHFFDIKLAEGNGGREQRRHPADNGHPALGRRDERIERKGTRHQVHARRHHRRRMDQRGDGGGAGHGIGQPDVERELR